MAPVAIVTGSDSGIGRATAVELARQGMDVGITWHEDEEGARGTAQEVEQLGRRAAVRRLDLADLPGAVDAVDELADELGGRRRPGRRTPAPASPRRCSRCRYDDWRHVLSVDLDGAFLCLQRAARRMVAAGNGGRVVRRDQRAPAAAAGRHGRVLRRQGRPRDARPGGRPRARRARHHRQRRRPGRDLDADDRPGGRRPADAGAPRGAAAPPGRRTRGRRRHRVPREPRRRLRHRRHLGRRRRHAADGPDGRLAPARRTTGAAPRADPAGGAQVLHDIRTDPADDRPTRAARASLPWWHDRRHPAARAPAAALPSPGATAVRRCGATGPGRTVPAADGARRVLARPGDAGAAAWCSGSPRVPPWWAPGCWSGTTSALGAAVAALLLWAPAVPALVRRRAVAALVTAALSVVLVGGGGRPHRAVGAGPVPAGGGRGRSGRRGAGPLGAGDLAGAAVLGRGRPALPAVVGARRPRPGRRTPGAPAGGRAHRAADRRPARGVRGAVRQRRRRLRQLPADVRPVRPAGAGGRRAPPAGGRPRPGPPGAGAAVVDAGGAARRPAVAPLGVARARRRARPAGAGVRRRAGGGARRRRRVRPRHSGSHLRRVRAAGLRPARGGDGAHAPGRRGVGPQGPPRDPARPAAVAGGARRPLPGDPRGRGVGARPDGPLRRRLRAHPAAPRGRRRGDRHGRGAAARAGRRHPLARRVAAARGRARRRAVGAGSRAGEPGRADRPLQRGGGRAGRWAPAWTWRTCRGCRPTPSRRWPPWTPRCERCLLASVAVQEPDHVAGWNLGRDRAAELVGGSQGGRGSGDDFGACAEVYLT